MQNIIQKCVIINRLPKSSKCVIINRSSIGLNITQSTSTKIYNKSLVTGIKLNNENIRGNYTKSPERICKVTGFNISMQKPSEMLSHTGLYYYYKTDRKVYNELKSKYLSEIWNKENHQIQIKEIAHSIRNTSSNRKIKQRKLYPEYQPVLFPMEQCI